MTVATVTALNLRDALIQACAEEEQPSEHAHDCPCWTDRALAPSIFACTCWRLRRYEKVAETCVGLFKTVKDHS